MGFSSVLVIKLYEELIEKDNRAALVGLMFPLIGLGLLVWAVRATIRWKRFGASVVQMSSVPGVLGGPVVGTVQTALRELPEKGFEFTLRSIHRTVSGSGKNRSTKEKILWQEEQRAKKEELYPGAGTEIYFPPARNPGMAGGLTLFFLIWSRFLWLMLHLGAPMIFPILFGLFWLLILFGVLDMWFGTSRAIVDADGLVIKSGLLGMGRRRTFPRSEIRDVKTKIGTQSGGRSGTPFYDLILVRRSGRDLLIGRYIKNKREAEWLAGEVKDCLGTGQS